MDINALVDADLVGNPLTRCSHTGVMVLIKLAPTVCYSKLQVTIESLKFGSEVLAICTCLDLIKEL